MFSMAQQQPAQTTPQRCLSLITKSTLPYPNKRPRLTSIKVFCRYISFQLSLSWSRASSSSSTPSWIYSKHSCVAFTVDLIDPWNQAAARGGLSLRLDTGLRNLTRIWTCSICWQWHNCLKVCDTSYSIETSACFSSSRDRIQLAWTRAKRRTRKVAVMMMTWFTKSLQTTPLAAP